MVAVERVREIVKKGCDEENWKFHILPTVKYARLLAEKLGADTDLAELGALLHDIGRIKFGGKDHEVTGIPEAEKILKRVNCPPEVIDEVRHCIESHRGSGSVKPGTKIARIVANADAMAHFDGIPFLLHLGLKKKNDLEKAVKWVRERIERSWNKLTIPEARESMRKKYEAAKLLISVENFK